ncbi:MAG: hypothetical protein FD126_3563, partial [Elusimicrobia bacterium]
GGGVLSGRVATEVKAMPELAGGLEQMPRYAALNPSGRPDGGAPHYGEMFLTLKPEVKGRSTVTARDTMNSRPGPEEFTAFGRLESVFRQYDGYLMREMMNELARPGSSDMMAGIYPEVQVFGDVRLRNLDGKGDVQAVNAPAEWKGRAEGTRVAAFAEKNGLEMRWYARSASAEVGAAEGPSAAARLHGRVNVALGQGFYRATGGSFGILPETFGRNSAGDPLLILERKTPPFSQLLPAAWRPRHSLSIGVNHAPDLASKKALLKAFSELTAPETLKRLGVGEPGGPTGFRVVTENPALVAFAKRFERDGWTVKAYEDGTGGLDRVQHWLQHPIASVRRLGESLL